MGGECVCVCARVHTCVRVCACVCVCVCVCAQAGGACQLPAQPAPSPIYSKHTPNVSDRWDSNKHTRPGVSMCAALPDHLD